MEANRALHLRVPVGNGHYGKASVSKTFRIHAPC